jgi:hypothetical protein
MIKREIGVAEVSRAFNVDLQTVRNWCAKGLPYEEVAKGLKTIKQFNLEEATKWVEEQRGN